MAKRLRLRRPAYPRPCNRCLKGSHARCRAKGCACPCPKGKQARANPLMTALLPAGLSYQSLGALGNPPARCACGAKATIYAGGAPPRCSRCHSAAGFLATRPAGMGAWDGYARCTACGTVHGVDTGGSEAQLGEEFVDSCGPCGQATRQVVVEGPYQGRRNPPRDDRSSYIGSDGQRHHRFTLGPNDTTPDVRTYPHHQATRQYDSRCGGCWAGNAHTEAYHDASVGKKQNPPEPPVPSKGHVGWVGDYEYYVDHTGNLHVAPKWNVIDVRSGYRIGRWEAPPHLVDQALSFVGLSRPMQRVAGKCKRTPSGKQKKQNVCEDVIAQCAGCGENLSEENGFPCGVCGDAWCGPCYGPEGYAEDACQRCMSRTQYVLCDCGWGGRTMPVVAIPDACPQCGGPMGCDGDRRENPRKRGRKGQQEWVATAHCPVHDAPGAVYAPNPRGKDLQKQNQKFLPLSSPETRHEVQAKYAELAARARAKGHYLLGVKPPPATLSSLRLLSESQKVVKGLKQGVVTAVLYLAPDTEYYGQTGKTMCPWATPECSAACLGHESGQMAMPDSTNARQWRTLLYAEDKPLFFRMLAEEIADFERRVHEYAPKFVPAVRLDGTSDLGLAGRRLQEYGGKSLAELFPGVVFYDYSKGYARMLEYLAAHEPNRHLTFSFSGHNEQEAVDVLARGGNVAVAFGVMKPKRGATRPKKIPPFWNGYPVVDADKTDVRFQDPPGHVAGLRLKYGHGGYWQALERAGAFVVRTDAPSVQMKPRGRRLPARAR